MRGAGYFQAIELAKAMRVGVPTEIKPDEYRVALTPAGVRELVDAGHEVLVQAGAGVGSAIGDTDYERQGARIVPRVEDVWDGSEMVEEHLPEADLVIGAVLVHGARAPHVITRAQLGLMKPQAVLVDVSIDQGGCFETSRPTTHSDPTNVGVRRAIAENAGLRPGVSVVAGRSPTRPWPRRSACPTCRSTRPSGRWRGCGSSRLAGTVVPVSTCRCTRHATPGGPVTNRRTATSGAR